MCVFVCRVTVVVGWCVYEGVEWGLGGEGEGLKLFFRLARKRFFNKDMEEHLRAKKKNFHA